LLIHAWDTLPLPRCATSLGNLIFSIKKSLTNASQGCFLPSVKMKAMIAPTLKHVQANERMSIWLRKCFDLGIVGMKF
jgi:hypothetical protein